MLDSGFEVRHVEAERTVWLPAHGGSVESQEPFGIRQRAPEEMKLPSKVREGLSITRLWPQRESSLAPIDRPIAMEQEVGDEARVPDGLDRPPGVRHSEPTEQLHLEHHCLPDGSTIRRPAP